MIYKMNLTMLVEISIRTTLWLLFIFFDQLDPFIRVIKEEEIWKYQYPVTQPIVSSTNLWIFISTVPSVFFLLFYSINRDKNELTNAIFGLTLSYALTGLFTSYLKVIVGRPRPDFYYRCFPDGHGNDYTKCTGSRKKYLDGRKSFPSGHSSLSFACMVFINMHIARKLNMFGKEKVNRKSWEMCACFIPLVIAVSIAISRTCDYHHHYEDVAAGALLGTAMSYTCYKLYFPETV